jgi:hypothetical protein
VLNLAYTYFPQITKRKREKNDMSLKIINKNEQEKI